MAQYMLLIRGGEPFQEEYSPEQFQRLIQPYIDWSNKLRAEGRSRGGEEIAAGGRTLRVRDGSFVVDGPYAETKEDIGGFFIIQAADEDEAIEVAKDCPTFHRGGFIELRAINEH
jgi:hypothetical protein